MNTNTFYPFLLATITFLLSTCNAQTQTAKQQTKSKSTKEFSTRIDSTQLLNDVKYLASDELEGRGTGEKGNEMAQGFIINRFEKLGVEKFNADYHQPFSFQKSDKKYLCNNIVGKITGTTKSDEYFVLTAHFDHLGIHDGKIFNGADDNASGVAAILAAAAFFKKNPPEHSILFVAFDAEELGLEGAKYFVENPPVPLEKILLNLNLDMISRNAKNEIYLAGTHHYPALKKELAQIDSQSSINVKFGHDTPDLGYNDWTNSSDHRPFHLKKIPFLYLGVEDHEDYHKHTDTFEKIDPSFFYHSSNLVLDILLAFD